MVSICLVWWGPLLLMFFAVKHWGRPPEIPKNEWVVLEVLAFFGWSIFITRTLCHRVIEPYFQVKTLQNPHHHLFRPEPYSYTSFRQWWRAMFCFVEDEPPTPMLAGKGARRAARRGRR